MNRAATEQSLGTLETVATFDGPMPTGVTVSHAGRMFVSFPTDHCDVASFVSVQSVVVGPLDRLWVLDTGSPEFRPAEVCGPKLVCVDLSTDTAVQTIVPPREVALEATYLNDVRFDLRRGDAGTAFISWGVVNADSSPNTWCTPPPWIL